MGLKPHPKKRNETLSASAGRDHFTHSHQGLSLPRLGGEEGVGNHYAK